MPFCSGVFMSSVISAIRDDEHSWYNLKKDADIMDCNWKLYSAEWDLARQGYNNGLVGRQLKMFVRHEVEKRELSIKHKKEQAELNQLIALEQKYK